MGLVYTEFRVERFPNMNVGINVPNGLVDTGAEFTWVSEATLRTLGIQPVKSQTLAMADGKLVKRNIGFAVLRIKKRFTADEVVFAQPGDLTLLGARTLEGLGLKVDSRGKRLVAAGPALAATAVRPETARSLGIIVPGTKGNRPRRTTKHPSVNAQSAPRHGSKKRRRL